MINKYKHKTILFIYLFICFFISATVYFYLQQHVQNIEIIKLTDSAKDYLIKYIFIRHIAETDSITVTVSAEDADTLTYSLKNNGTDFILNDKIIRIPIKYLALNKDNKILIQIKKTNNKILKKEITVKAFVDKTVTEYLPDIKVIKNNTSNKLYYFCFCIRHIKNEHLVPVIIDTKGNIRSLYNNELIEKYSNISNEKELKIGNFTINTKRAFIYGKQGNIIRFAQNNNSQNTINGVILELSPKDNKIITIIDTEKILDKDRLCQLDKRFKEIIADWLHPNSLFYNRKDDSIIVSSRHQGIFKIDSEGKLKWILSPHKDYKYPQNKYLLKATDLDNNILPDKIQNGTENYITDNYEFEWPWAQHCVSLINDTDLLVFDNGFYRNFNYNKKYSRAVIYRIDEKNMTVKQIWQYGKELGENFYSLAIGTVYKFNDTILINSAFIVDKDNKSFSVVKEVELPTKQINIEFTFKFKGVTKDEFSQYWYDDTADARIIDSEQELL